MQPNKPTVAILHGFCEGPRLSAELERALATKGFALTSDAANADIIIAHSGGCWIVPPNARAQTIVLVGLTFWPGKPLATRMTRKIIRDIATSKRQHRLKAFGAKTLQNGRYFWQMQRNVQMFRARDGRGLQTLHAQRVIVLRNRNDAFCTSDIYNWQPLSNAAFVSLPGEHDDIWQRPKRYVDVLSSITPTGA
jgi:hypothetical protein